MGRLSTGQILHERYRIEQLVAQGGYGAVYRAHDAVLRRTCAVKENLAQGPDAEAQFEREALLLARLDHPNLPRVFDHFVVPEQGQYLVMDYVQGSNVDAILRQRRHPFSQAEALTIIGEVCSALDYLHRQAPPIVHRDVKPQNIIVTPQQRVMLVDFGLSRVLEPGSATLPSQRGLSPGYAAPEQYGAGPTGPQSDVYALGATLYTMLTCQRPPDAVDRMLNGLVPAPIERYALAVSSEVEEAVNQAMALSTTQRLSSVATFQRLLTTKQRAVVHPTRMLWAIAALVLVGLLVIAVAAALRLRGRMESSATAPVAVAVAVAGATATPTAGSRQATATAMAAITPSPAASLPAGLATKPLAVGTMWPLPTPTATALIDPTATPTPIPSPTQPVVVVAPTPACGGGRITFVARRNGKRDILQMDANGDNVVNLTDNPADDWPATWSPDGQHLVFASDRSGNWEIYRQDADGANVTQLTLNGGEDHDPIWSPDGQRILFHSDREVGYWRLYTMDISGGELRRLTDDPVGTWSGSWSPDGRQIAYAANYPSPGEIYVMNADGSEAHNLTNSSTHESSAEWSPDGQQLVFYSERDGNRELYSMNADGSDQLRLTNNDMYDNQPDWSPDGRCIVFVRGGETLNVPSDLYVLRLNDKSSYAITHDGQGNANPVWTR